MELSLEEISRYYTIDLSVLDGELAVPCNLKSAYAGLNSDGWVLLSLIFIISGVDSFSFTQ